MSHDTEPSAPGPPRLLRGAPTDITITARYEWPQGWRARVLVRRQLDEWSEADTSSYSRLSTDELVDTLSSAVDVALRGVEVD